MAHDPSGGTTTPQIDTATCTSNASASCTTGDFLRVTGQGLEGTRTVTFLGEPGRNDDRRVKPRSRGFHAVMVKVPRNARSGPVRLSTRISGQWSTTPPIQVVTATVMQVNPGTTTQAGVFPVSGEHTYGTNVNRFGGGRGHQGQDVLANCGTPVLAALSGTVSKVAYQSAAGNYAVVDAADGTSQAYMHLSEQASVSVGQAVSAGQAIGTVGQTGRATTCHLHFELWTAPGWYKGGSAIDPLPLLQQLEGLSAAAR
jgi:murein DD-endopeptidase MepM/ murein hydrolase activator NlpD